MHVVAVFVPRPPGAVRVRLAAWRAARGRAVPALAGTVGVLLRSLFAAVLAVRGAAGLALVAYGAWLAWPPAGPIVVGVGLLADRVLDERRPRDAERP